MVSLFAALQAAPASDSMATISPLSALTRGTCMAWSGDTSIHLGLARPLLALASGLTSAWA
eukprot:3853992-Alexandrium_andersonii.AAC.1